MPMMEAEDTGHGNDTIMTTTIENVTSGGDDIIMANTADNTSSVVMAMTVLCYGCDDT